MMQYSHSDQLRRLLDRYYAAETTPDDEKLLRELLSAPGLSEEFVTDRDTVLGLASTLPPEGFEQRLADKIDSLAASSHTVAAGKASRRRHIVLRWCAAAAAVAIIVITAATRLPSASSAQPTPLTPEETYEQVEMALMMFSETISKGYSALEQADAATIEATGNLLFLETI